MSRACAAAGARLVVGALLLWGTGCTVDTELGVAARIESARLSVSGTDPTVTITLEMDVELRVGEHAMGERAFEITTADLFVGERPVATVNLDRTPTFDYRLSPGQREVVPIRGSLSGALGAERALLCAADPVQLLLRWRDTTADEISMADATVTSVACD